MLRDHQGTSSFSKHIATVIDMLLSDNYSDVNMHIESCVLSYDDKYEDTTAAQLVELLSAIWNSKPDINFHPLHRVMRPLFEGRLHPEYLVTHYENPAVIRSFLMLSAILDSANSEVDSIPQSKKPQVIAQLDYLYAKKNIDTDGASRVELTGKALMEHNWEILQSIYTLPDRAGWRFSDALRAIPDGLMCLSKTKRLEITPLPASLAFD